MLAHNQLCKFTAPGPIGNLVIVPHSLITQNYIFHLHKIQWGFPAQVQEEQSSSKFEKCMLAHNQLCKFTAPGPMGSPPGAALVLVIPRR